MTIGCRWVLPGLLLGLSGCFFEKPWADFAAVSYQKDVQQVCVAIPKNEGRQDTVFYILNTSVEEEKRGVLWQHLYTPGHYAVKRGECLQIPVPLTEPGNYLVFFGSVTTPSAQGDNKKRWTRRFEVKQDETGKPVLLMIN